MRAEIDKLSTPKGPFGSSMARAHGNRRIATFHRHSGAPPTGPRQVARPAGKLSSESSFQQHTAPKKNGHSIHVDKANKFALCCDLGQDKVVIYAFDAAKGTLTPHGAFNTPKGAGPRHFAWHPDGKKVGFILGNEPGSLRILQLGNGMTTVTDRPIRTFAGWDATGDFPDIAAWTHRVEAEARNLAAPVRVTLSATQVASLEGSAIQPWSVRTCDSIMKRAASL